MDRFHSTTRFTDRVDEYVRYRPGYPRAIVDTLEAVAGLSPASVVADVGSGTGISTALFLAEGCDTFAVEPNAAMRAAAERRFAGDPKFHSVDGRAEATTLPDAAVDLVTAAQAFHWFDLDAARREFARIRRPGGRVALFWNDRRTAASAFLAGYEALLQEYATDYAATHGRNLAAADLDRFFGGARQTYTFPNEQVFDFDGLAGRLLSSSYAPRAGDPRHDPMMRALRRLFDAYAGHGRIRFPYETTLFIGPPLSS